LIEVDLQPCGAGMVLNDLFPPVHYHGVYYVHPVYESIALYSATPGYP
jgi:hypothetical protein